jgi:hypothetical protein
MQSIVGIKLKPYPHNKTSFRIAVGGEYTYTYGLPRLLGGAVCHGIQQP